MQEERIIPEVAVATSVCPHPEKWHCYDEMATEVEVLDFLTALVRMLKPAVALETGCYHGHGTRAIASALFENNRGVLYTCDSDHSAMQSTRERLDKLHSYVLMAPISGLELIAIIDEVVDFAFLDSGGDEVRMQELRVLYPKLSLGAVVAIHDTGIQGFLREKYLRPTLDALGMQAIYFDTPRGLTLCRKRPEIYP